MSQERQEELIRTRARLAELEAAERQDRDGEASSGEPVGGWLGDKAKPLIITLAAIVFVGAVIWVMTTPNGPADQTAASGTSAAAADPVWTPPVDAGPISRWSYFAERDPMTDSDTRFACILSDNQVKLDFPYTSQEARLCLRRSKRFGLDVTMSLPEGGQFRCRSSQDCAVLVRFDDGQTVRFNAVEPADGSSDTIFIRRSASFLESIKTADVTRIEAEYYQNGSQVSQFETRLFDPAKFEPGP